MRGGSYRLGMGWLSRRLRRDNALRRPIDRLESGSVFAAVLLVIASVPLALGFGFAVYQSNLADSARHLAADRYVAATLLQDATSTSVAQGMRSTVPVRAQWNVSPRVRRTGQVNAPNGAVAGSTVPLLIDRHGRQARTPLTGGEALERGALAAMAVVGGFAVLLGALTGVLRWRLNQRRYAAWAAEWREVCPQWTEQSG
jgi:hypothetical protein